MLHVAQEHIKNAVTGLSNMISKPGYQTFVYYNHFSRQNQWRTDFTQLRENGFQFIILDRGIDLKTQLAVSDHTAKLEEIIETAESEGLSTVLHIGNPKDLYMLPDSWQWRLDYVKHVVSVLGGCRGLYALLLEDTPTGGSQFSAERWQIAMEPLERRLATMKLTNAEYQFERRTWQQERYASYIADMVKTVKKAKSTLKTTVSFHLDALIPVDTHVHFQNTARALDFVMIDPGVLPYNNTRHIDHVSRWTSCLSRTLTEKDIWLVVGSQVASGRYHTTLRELREWTSKACSNFVSAVGWHGWLDNAWYEDNVVRGMSLEESNPEHWATINALSRSLADRKRTGNSTPTLRCVLSYDSIVNRVPWLDLITPHHILEESTGRDVGYVSDSQLAEGDPLTGCHLLFSTPSPAARGKVVDRLIGYMEQGGWIVGSGDDFTLDAGLRHSDARRRLFGIRQESVLNDPDRILLTSGWPHLEEGAVLNAYQSRVRPTECDDDVRVLARWGDGSAAVVIKPHGKGGAVYVGTDLYLTAERDQNGGWHGFLRDILNRRVLKSLSLN